jgi:aminoglycoside phosphotransferase (APT) family kinase protein
MAARDGDEMGRFILADIPPRCARHLPAGASLEFPPQGMTSDVAFATGTGPAVAVKRCDHPVYLPWLRREHSVLRALADTGLRVPAVMGYEERSQASRAEGWLITTRLAGTSLWRVVLERNPGARGPLFRALGALLRRLHATPVPAALASAQPWLARTLAQAQQNLAWCDGSAELLAELERSAPAPVPEVLIHGDLALDNVLIDEAGELGLVDWSQGGPGDPRTDVALALQTLPEAVLTHDEQDAFYDGYGQAPLDEYTRRWFEQLYEFF